MDTEAEMPAVHTEVNPGVIVDEQRAVAVVVRSIDKAMVGTDRKVVDAVIVPMRPVVHRPLVVRVVDGRMAVMDVPRHHEGRMLPAKMRCDLAVMLTVMLALVPTRMPRLMPIDINVVPAVTVSPLSVFAVAVIPVARMAAVSLGG